MSILLTDKEAKELIRKKVHEAIEKEKQREAFCDRIKDEMNQFDESTETRKNNI